MSIHQEEDRAPLAASSTSSTTTTSSSSSSETTSSSSSSMTMTTMTTTTTNEKMTTTNNNSTNNDYYHDESPVADPPIILIDMRTCTPDELANWLMKHRFVDDAMGVTSFLLECTSSLPDAEGISARLMMGGCVDDDDDDDEEEDIEEEEKEEMEMEREMEGEGEIEEDCDVDHRASATGAATAASEEESPRIALLRSIESSPSPVPSFSSHHHSSGKKKKNDDDYDYDYGHHHGIEVSCVVPRGRLRLSVYRDGIVLTDPKDPTRNRVPIPRRLVERIITFRKPEDYRKIRDENRRRRRNIGGGGGGGGGVGGAITTTTTTTTITTGHVVLICLAKTGKDDDGIFEYKGKPLPGQVCFQLPSYDVGGNGSSPTEDDWRKGLGIALLSQSTAIDSDAVGTTMVRVEDEEEEGPRGCTASSSFRSSTRGEEYGGSSSSTTTTGGMPYVGCHNGFHDGVLFPLKEGLLFYKPPLFVHRSKLASISCGRGSGGSRYVDVIARLVDDDDDDHDHDDDDDASSAATAGKKKKGGKRSASSGGRTRTLEFTNVHREELPGLNDYVHKVLIPAMRSDADGTIEEGEKDGDVKVVREGDDDEDDDDDADYADDAAVAAREAFVDRDEDAHIGESEGGRRGRPMRAASRAARAINRAALSAPSTATKSGGFAGGEDEDEDEDDESDAFREEDADVDVSSEDDDSDALSDGESVSSEDDGSSSDGWHVDEEDDTDGSDYDDRRRKKARAE